jgi:hypothetical protein
VSDVCQTSVAADHYMSIRAHLDLPAMLTFPLAVENMHLSFFCEEEKEVVKVLKKNSMV